MVLVIILSEIRAFRFSNIGVTIDFIISNFIPFLLFLGFLQTVGRQKWILFVGLVASVLMVHQAYTQISHPLGIGWAEAALPRGDSLQARYIGIFNDPNDMGMFLLMNIPIAAFFLVNSKNVVVKLLWLTAIVLLLLGIYWTKSRGSLVGTMIVFMGFFYIRYGKVKSIILGLLASPAAIFVMSRFRSIGAEDESANARIEAWYQGVQMFKYRPLFGVGKDQFIEYHHKTAHNSYVLVMSELGVVGYTLWISFILLIFYMMFKVIQLDPTKSPAMEKVKTEQSIALYLTVSILGFCATAFFLSRSYVLFFYVFAAMCTATYIRTSRLHKDLPAKIPNDVIFKTVMLSVISLIVLYVIISVLLSI
jgi:O-antigen ligase